MSGENSNGGFGEITSSGYIPGRKSRGQAVRYDRRRYKRRNRIEIMFGRLKDWRRIATRYDRCAKTFLSAVALAATVIFWL
jgi:transposase